MLNRLPFFYLILILCLLGIVAIADVSMPTALSNFNDKFYFVKQQSIAVTVGVVAFLIISKIKVDFWKKISTPFLFFGILLLLIVFIPGVSYKALGARRWIDLGFTSFQPSEVIKLALILYFAKLTESKKELISYLIPLVVIVGLIMLQPDLGTSLIIASIAFSQIFVSEINIFKFLGTIAAGIATTLGLIFLSPYRRDRLYTFLDLTADPLGKGYHVRQVLLALGSGGIFGVGIGNSRQKNLFLPESSTDSIFAVIAEEIGFVGAMVFILIFVYLIYRCFKIASSAVDVYSKSLAIGITGWIAGQTILNIGAMTALVPLTGIPLPFFSYGGTSVVTLLVACGILGSIESNSHGSTITKKSRVRR